MQLEEKFQNYRLPRQSDNLEEDIKYARDHSHSACLGVAVGNFVGHARADYLIGLTAKGGDGALVVVALRRRKDRELVVLDEWKEGRSRLYVAVGAPGTYNMVGDNDGPLEKGEVEKLVCPHDVPIVGATESSGVAYCLLKGKWQHTWISD